MAISRVRFANRISFRMLTFLDWVLVSPRLKQLVDDPVSPPSSSTESSTQSWTRAFSAAVSERVRNVFGTPQPARTRSAQQFVPPTPALPRAARRGYAAVNGVRIWHAIYGQGAPVVLLHGAYANSNYWGLQVPVLARSHQVIVMDSRGHGRSTRDDRPYSYSELANDVLGVMDHLNIDRAAIVGWSIGANIGLHLAVHHPGRISKVFCFAPEGHPGPRQEHRGNPLFRAYLARAANEYALLSTTTYTFRTLKGEMARLRTTAREFTGDELRQIRAPVWIVDGTYDDVADRVRLVLTAGQIPGATLVVQPSVGHFSFLQQPQQFNRDLLEFLDGVKSSAAATYALGSTG